MSFLQVRALEACHGQFKAVKSINLDVALGERIALVGANGAGKTTLLKSIAGIHPASKGKVIVDGQDITDRSAHQRVALGVALVPEGRRLFETMSVEDNLLVALSANRSGAWSFETVLEAFPQLKAKLKALAGSLSGGQQQAVAIGRALMTNPRILLLDEVSLGLSPVAVQGVYDSLQSLMAGQTTVILVEQDLQRAFSVSNRLVCMLEGEVVAIGNTHEMTREQVMKHYFGHRAVKETA